jgi:peptidyl-tRNA hydrolase
VLGQWTDEENSQLPAITEKATTAIQMYLTVGIEKAMTFVNQK